MGDSAVTDRRRGPRTTLGLPATLQRLGARTATGMAMTCDLSEGGARLVGPDTFDVGDVVIVTISSGELTIENQGLIVGHQQGSDSTAMLNVAFKTVGDRDLAVLRQIIDPS